MNTFRYSLAALSLTVFCGLSTSQAQQTIPTAPTIPPQQTIPSQPLIQDGQLRSQDNQSDRYESRKVSADANQAGPTVKEAIVQKLMKSNEAEIELAKMAMQKTDNEDVKQFCQTIVKDHQACNQKIEQMKRQNQTSGSQSATVPKELCQIAEQTCDNVMKMTKEMLSKHDGQDFDMAFLSQQCVAHTMMVAELKAIESTGSSELQSLAQEAGDMAEKHLSKAKQLAKKLQDDRTNEQS